MPLARDTRRHTVQKAYDALKSPSGYSGSCASRRKTAIWSDLPIGRLEYPAMAETVRKIWDGLKVGRSKGSL